MSTSNPSPRVLLQVQPGLTHYRASLIDNLAKSSRVKFDFMAYCPTEETATQGRFPAPPAALAVPVTPIRRFEFRALRWEPEIVSAALRGRYDVAVLEGRVYSASAWLAALIFRARGTSVLFWGHGWKRPESGIKLFIRRLFYSMGSGLLLYGERGKAMAKKAGLRPERLYVVYNSLYSRDQLLDAKRRRTPLSTEVLRERPVLIVAGRLTTRHSVASLAPVLQRVKRDYPSLRMVVVGDGPQRAQIERDFGALEIEYELRGSAIDFESLRDLYAPAVVALSAGASGLNVVQALGFGVPMVARQDPANSGPEIELIEDHGIGVVVGDSDDEFAQAVVELLRDEERRQRLSEMGDAAVLDRYTSDSQAHRFEEAIMDCLKERAVN